MTFFKKNTVTPLTHKSELDGLLEAESSKLDPRSPAKKKNYFEENPDALIQKLIIEDDVDETNTAEKDLDLKKLKSKRALETINCDIKLPEEILYDLSEKQMGHKWKKLNEFVQDPKDPKSNQNQIKWQDENSKKWLKNYEIHSIERKKISPKILISGGQEKPIWYHYIAKKNYLIEGYNLGKIVLYDLIKEQSYTSYQQNEGVIFGKSNADGDFLVTFTAQSACVWDLTMEKINLMYNFNLIYNSIKCFDFHPKNSTFICIGNNFETYSGMTIFDIQNKKEIETISNDYRFLEIIKIKFDHDGKRVFYVDSENSLGVWYLTDKNNEKIESHKILFHSNEKILLLILSNNNEFLYYVTEEEKKIIYEFNIKEIRKEKYVNKIIIQPSYKIISFSEQNPLMIFQVSNESKQKFEILDYSLNKKYPFLKSEDFEILEETLNDSKIIGFELDCITILKTEDDLKKITKIDPQLSSPLVTIKIKMNYPNSDLDEKKEILFLPPNYYMRHGSNPYNNDIIFILSDQTIFFIDIHKNKIIHDFPLYYGQKFHKLYDNPFIDEQVIILCTYNEFGWNTLIVFNVYYGRKLCELVLKTKSIDCFSVSHHDSSIYFNIESEIFLLKYTRAPFKSYAIKDCRKIHAFDYDINMFTYLKEKNHLCINLNNKNSLFIYDLTTSRLILELKGHSQNIFNFAVDQNQKILVSVCNELRFIVWNLETYKEINTLFKGNHLDKKREKNELRNLVISSDGTKIIVTQRDCFLIWDIKFRFPLCKIQRRNYIMSLSYECESESIYIFDQELNLEKWKLSNEYILYDRVKDLRNFELIKKYATFNPNPNENLLLNGGTEEVSIYDWKNQKLTKSIKLVESIINKFKYLWAPNGNSFFLFTPNINAWRFYYLDGNIWKIKEDLNDDEKYNYFFIETTDLYSIHDNLVSFYCLEIYTNNIICYFFDLNSKIITNEEKFEYHDLNTITGNPINSNEICLGTADGTIIVFDWIKKKKIYSLLGHTDIVLFLAYRSDGKKICSSGGDGSILIWNTDSEDIEMCLRGHSLTINSVQFSPDLCRLVSCGRDSTIRIWNLNSRHVETIFSVYENVEVNNCEFSKDGKFICAGFNEGLVYEVFNFDQNLQQYMIISLLKNMRNFDELCSQVTHVMIENLTINFLHPFGFSILHSLLYLELYEEFSYFINLMKYHKVKFAFFVDWTNRTVLDICRDRNLFSLLLILIEYLIEFPPSIKNTSEKFQESILNLIPLKLHLIEKLLDSRIVNIKLNKEFYCEFHQETRLKSIRHSQPYLSEFFRLFPQENTSNNVTKLSCEVLALKNVLFPSNNFCENLLNYPTDHPIFIAKSTQYIINYKWEHYGRMAHMKRFLDFFILILFATINSFYLFIARISYGEGNNSIYKYLSASIISFITIYWTLPYIIYEIKDFISEKFRNYFKNFWNFVDLLNIFLLTIVFIMEMIEMFVVSTYGIQTALKLLHSILLFFLWLKLLSFSTIFEGTAFIYRSITKILLEMKYFLLILFILDLMTSFTLFILQEYYPEQIEDYSDNAFAKKTRLQVMFLYYRLILGDYGDYFEMNPAISYLFQIIFIISTILMFIILMNLLISLVSMMFTDVLQTKDNVYNYEKASLIAEMDRNFSEKQKEKIMKTAQLDSYLLICQPKTVKSGTQHDRYSKRSTTDNQKNLSYDLVDKINFEFGSQCEECKTPLKEDNPQYYCYFCDLWFCPSCGDKIDENKKGSAKLLHPHNLVWIDVKSNEFMKRIDSYKMGRNLWFNEDVYHLRFGCNGCEKIEDKLRWTCLSCRPGKYRSNGFVDFCNECMDTIKKREKNQKLESIIEKTIEENHDIDTHVYLRIYFGNSYNDY